MLTPTEFNQAMKQINIAFQSLDEALSRIHERLDALEAKQTKPKSKK